MNADDLYDVLQLGVLFMTIVWILDLLKWPSKRHRSKKLKKLKTLVVRISVDGKQGEEGMPVTLPVDKTALATIEGKDSKGNTVPVTFDTPPTWSVSDGSLISVTPAADGVTATVTPLVNSGKATVGVSAVIGGKPYTGTSDEIDLAAGALASIGINLTVQ